MGNSTGSLCAHVETKDQRGTKSAEPKAEPVERTPTTGDLGDQGKSEKEAPEEEPQQVAPTDDGDIAESTATNHESGTRLYMEHLIEGLILQASIAPVQGGGMDDVELWSLESADQCTLTPVDACKHNLHSDSSGNNLSITVNGTTELLSLKSLKESPMASSPPITAALMCEISEKEDSIVYGNHDRESDKIGENKVPVTIFDPNETSEEESKHEKEGMLQTEPENLAKEGLAETFEIPEPKNQDMRPELMNLPEVNEITPRQHMALSIRSPTCSNKIVVLGGEFGDEEYCRSLIDELLPQDIAAVRNTIGRTLVDEAFERYTCFHDVGTNAVSEQHDASTSMYVCAEENSAGSMMLIGELEARVNSEDNRTLECECHTEDEVPAVEEPSTQEESQQNKEGWANKENVEAETRTVKRRAVPQSILHISKSADYSSKDGTCTSVQKSTASENSQIMEIRDASQQTISHPVVQVDELSCSFVESSKGYFISPIGHEADRIYVTPLRKQTEKFSVVDNKGAVCYLTEGPFTIDAACEGSICTPSVNKRKRIPKVIEQMTSDLSSDGTLCSSSSSSHPVVKNTPERITNDPTGKSAYNCVPRKKLFETFSQNQKTRTRNEAGDIIVRKSAQQTEGMGAAEKAEIGMNGLLQVLQSTDDFELLPAEELRLVSVTTRNLFRMGNGRTIVDNCSSSIYGDQENNNRCDSTNVSDTSSIRLERLKSPESVRVDQLDDFSLSHYAMCY